MTPDLNSTPTNRSDSQRDALKAPTGLEYSISFRGLGVGGSGIFPSAEFELAAGDYLLSQVRSTTARCFEKGALFKACKTLSADLAEKYPGAKLYVVTSLSAVLETSPVLRESPFTLTTVGVFHEPSKSLFLDREFISSLGRERKQQLREDIDFNKPGTTGLIAGGDLLADWKRFQQKRKSLKFSPALSGSALPVSNSPLRECTSLDPKIIRELIARDSQHKSLKVIERHGALFDMLLLPATREAPSPTWRLEYSDTLQIPLSIDPLLKVVSVAPKLLELETGFQSMLGFAREYQLFAGNSLASRGDRMDGTFAIQFALRHLLSSRPANAQNSLEQLQLASEDLFEEPQAAFSYRLAHDTLSCLKQTELAAKVRSMFTTPEHTNHAIEALGRSLAAQSPAFWEQYGITSDTQASNLVPMLSELLNYHHEKDPCNPVQSYTFVATHPASLESVRLDDLRSVNPQDRLTPGYARRGESLELEQLGVWRSYRTLPKELEAIALSAFGVSQLKTVHTDALQLFRNFNLLKVYADLQPVQTDPDGRPVERYKQNPGTIKYLFSLTQRHALLETIGEGLRVSVPQTSEFLTIRAAIINTLSVDTFSKPIFTSVVSPAAKAAIAAAKELQKSNLNRALADSVLPIAKLVMTQGPHEEIGRTCLANPLVRARLLPDSEALLENYRKKANTFWEKHYDEAIGYFSCLEKNYLPVTAGAAQIAGSFIQNYGLDLLRQGPGHTALELLPLAIRIVATDSHGNAQSQGESLTEKTLSPEPLSVVRDLFITATTSPGQPRNAGLDSFLNYQRSLTQPDFHPSLQPVWTNLITRDGLAGDGSPSLRRLEIGLNMLELADPNYRAGIVKTIAPDATRLVAFLTSQAPRVLKAFVLQNSQQELIKETFQHRDIDKIRELLASFSLTDVLQVTHDTLDSHSRKIIRNREIYEQANEQFPRTISHRYDDYEIPNHFAILGVPRTADSATIKRSYRLLSEMYHPDRFMNESGEAQELAREKLKAIIDAHEVLSDREKRVKYTASLPVLSYLYPTVAWFKDLPSLDG